MLCPSSEPLAKFPWRAILASGLASLFSVGVALAQSAPTQLAGRLQATASTLQDRPDLLAGIIQYTQWPAPKEPLRLCVDQGDPDTAAITAYFSEHREQHPHVQASVQHVQGATLDELGACQVIYFGKSTARTLPALLAQLSSRPVLTVGQGEDFCTDSGLFCLIDTTTGTRIGANLDAIARSGLRINPRLLRLTQQPDKGRL